MSAAGLMAIAAAIAVLVGVGAGISTGNATAKAVEAISRQPEASGKITTALVIGNAFAEATAVYGLLIAIMILGKIVL
ncbi:ATP synthase F0 subunit C [Clostridium swellfunianum]|uniref:ATP synthase F0 subunit C n=1 Tax=Clostridium swellfunianum TaxID=1367462 RepID=UPI00202F0E14|nr:ATP synthase F0 subunit C [Clostridium swellfunianum]MCM0647551.1 ATP synthase F0 subunit C [Clostridium swellfunianum]